MIDASAIRKAISELLEGTIDTVRDMTAVTVRPFTQSLSGKLLVNTRYNIAIQRGEQHDASPVSAIGSHRIDRHEVVITFHHDLASNIQESSRNTVRDNVIELGDIARQALGYPNNLTTTASATATGIISGMLTNLTHDIDSENWDDKPPRLVSTLRGDMLVHVTQPTS
jgi:hypothetical protein